MRIPGLSGALTAVCFIGIFAVSLTFPEDTPLPNAWNPGKPLSLEDPVSPLTGWKLSRALASPAQCLSVLQDEGVAALSPLEEPEQPGCGISHRVDVSRVGQARLAPFESDCRTVLTLAMWERHSVQPAARTLLRSGVAELLHLSSYACRPIRTASGNGSRFSTHATAKAIDVTGVVLEDGRRITLVQDWDGAGPEARFLRQIRDGACDWFGATLGPDFNALHADHFHLQVRGRGLCR